MTRALLWTAGLSLSMLACSRSPTMVPARAAFVPKNSGVSVIGNGGPPITDGAFVLQGSTTANGTDSLVGNFNVTNTSTDSAFFYGPGATCQVSLIAISRTSPPDTATVYGGNPDTTSLGMVCIMPASLTILGPHETKPLPGSYWWRTTALAPDTFDIVATVGPPIPLGTIVTHPKN